MSLNSLHNWYHQNKRDLPWRHTQEPYFIWLSEIILQQTRVEQGLNYYLKFTAQFPTIFHLAGASQEQVLKLWQGLGYYSRARNMHETAKLIVSTLNGVFPNSSLGLQKLKGIGPYTAAAIASFSYNEPVAVLDGNVFRVLSRLFEVSVPINVTEGKQVFTKIASDFLDEGHPAIHNQAMMELGAMVCKPKNPLCGECPLRPICQSYKSGNVKNYPVKIKKLNVKNRCFHYLAIQFQEQIQIKQRQKGDIWEGLYDLPMIEGSTVLDELTLLEKLRELYPELDGIQLSIQRKLDLKHLLTHQKIYASFYEIIPIKALPCIQESYWVPLSSLKKFPASRLFEKFQESLNLQ
jgi:A/G-specific adenine glycosylase